MIWSRGRIRGSIPMGVRRSWQKTYKKYSMISKWWQNKKWRNRWHIDIDPSSSATPHLSIDKKTAWQLRRQSDSTNVAANFGRTEAETFAFCIVLLFCLSSKQAPFDLSLHAVYEHGIGVHTREESNPWRHIHSPNLFTLCASPLFGLSSHLGAPCEAFV